MVDFSPLHGKLFNKNTSFCDKRQHSNIRYVFSLYLRGGRIKRSFCIFSARLQNIAVVLYFLRKVTEYGDFFWKVKNMVIRLHFVRKGVCILSARWQNMVISLYFVRKVAEYGDKFVFLSAFWQDMVISLCFVRKVAEYGDHFVFCPQGGRIW